MPMTGFVDAADLPLADEDVVVTIEVNGASVDRKVFAGTRVPAELVEAWREQTGAPLSDGERRAQDAEAERVKALEELDADPEAAEQGDPAPARRTSRSGARRNG